MKSDFIPIRNVVSWQKLFVTVFVLLSYQAVFAQTDFKNEGEQENWWAKQAFTANYKQQSFEKYNGSITVTDSTCTFGNQALKVYGQPEFRTLFKDGVLYPSILLFANNGIDTSIKIRLINSNNKTDESSQVTKNGIRYR